MPIITLPDNSKRKYDQPLSIDEIANDIGPGLAKATVAAKVPKHCSCTEEET